MRDCNGIRDGDPMIGSISAKKGDPLLCVHFPLQLDSLDTGQRNPVTEMQDLQFRSMGDTSTAMC
jgi:hypothetical protein